MADALEAALARAAFDRGPWLAVAFAGGIAAWVVLDSSVEWVLAESGGPFGDVFALERDREGPHGRIMKVNLSRA